MLSLVRVFKFSLLLLLLLFSFEKYVSIQMSLVDNIFGKFIFFKKNFLILLLTKIVFLIESLTMYMCISITRIFIYWVRKRLWNVHENEIGTE